MGAVTESAHRKSPRRRFIRFTAIALLVLFMPVFVLAATVAATGTITVEIHERGGLDLYLPVPAVVVDVAAWVVPTELTRAVEPSELRQARETIEPWMPALRAVAEELERCPDTVLVEVVSRPDLVRIIKRGRTIEIEVASDDADVTVTVPARLVGRAIDVLAL